MEFKVYEELWFPTPIWECPVIGIDNKAIKEYCLRVREEEPGVVISNRGGWHSNKLINPLPKDLSLLFENLTLFINDVCARHMGTCDLKLGNFWININGKYDYNLAHDHQKSIVSGVYYVSVPDTNMGDLVLERGDNAEFFLAGGLINKQTTANAPKCIKSPKESVFYLFPSWVRHYVERNESDNERISIAFNFVPYFK